jgi:hypothetical protein
MHYTRVELAVIRICIFFPGTTCKSGRTLLASRSLKLAFAFLLGQILVAPAVFLVLLFAIYRF